jgi:hypothetical protein
VLQKTPLGWATIDANWDGQIPKVDGRSTAARRAWQRNGSYNSAVPRLWTSSRWPRSSGPLNYPVVADTARAMAMRGAGLRRSGPDRAPGRNLQLDKRRKPPAPSLKDYVASRRPAS